MTGRKTITSVAILMLLFCMGVSVQAQKRYERNGRSSFLGEAAVDGANDHDRITVGRADGKFHALQIQVQRAPIEFQRVVVHYGNGGDEELNIKQRIGAGSSTRWIDLKGDQRTITSVDFWYSKGDWSRRRPTVRLYGR